MHPALLSLVPFPWVPQSWSQGPLSFSPGCSVLILHPPQIPRQPVPQCPSPSGLPLPTSVLCVRGTLSPTHTCSLFLGSIPLGLGLDLGLSLSLCLYVLILRGQNDAHPGGEKAQEKNTRSHPRGQMQPPTSAVGGMTSSGGQHLVGAPCGWLLRGCSKAHPRAAHPVAAAGETLG